MRTTIIGILFILISVVAFGQKCKNYHKRNCYSYGYPFEYSPQSKDLKLISNESLEIDIMVMAGYEYNVSIDFDDLLGDVVFQITNDSKSIVYYNSLNETERLYNKQFAVDETKKLKVVISVPKSKIRNVHYGPPRCGGLLVEYSKQPHLGF